MKRSLSATTALVASLSLLATNPVVAQTATDGSTTTQTDTTVTTTDATTGSAVATDGSTPCDPALTDQSATDNATDGLSNIDTAVSAVTNLLGGGDNADTSATTTAEGDATAAVPCDDGSGTTASASGDASSDAATTTAPDTATAAGEADGAAAGDASANTAATTTGGADGTATAQDGSATTAGSGEAQSDGSVTVTSEGPTAAEGDATAAQSTAAQNDATAADGTATAQTTAQTGADANAQQNTSGEVIPLEELTNTGDGDTAAAMSGEGASVAAAAEGEAGTAQVETEQVTESRSSMEDFDTKVNLEPDAQAQTQANAQASGGNDDDGLSKLEKGLLVGAGALAVGALLRNNAQVVANSGDRVVVRRNNDLQVLKDDNALLRTPGAEVETQTFSDGSSRQIVTRSDGSKIITVRDENLRVIQRTKVFADGDRTVLFDDTVDVEPVEVSQLPRASTRSEISVTPDSDVDSLRQALNADLGVDRRFSLRQIRDISEVRTLAPALELEAVTFPTGSAAIQPSQAQELAALGSTIKEMIDRNPREVFLVEGHTDAVGSAAYNLALSDRRAETIALALTEYFDVPPENLVVQGYGEAFLKVPTQQAERENRRATVRRITPLLRTAAPN